MKLKISQWLQIITKFYSNHKTLVWIAFGSVIAVPILLVGVCNQIIQSNAKYILPAQSSKHAHVGLVLGAGITSDGKPFKELQGRLDTAADALQKGQVDKLILSGDNRFTNYNEPEAMLHYLTDVKHIAANKLQPDYAGRSTYESCERAAKIFDQNQLIIFSAASHLPRAIYLCRHFGIEAYGIPGGAEANNWRRREPLARVKAIFNIYLLGENSLLGNKIPV